MIGRVRLRWAGPLAAVAIVAGAATGIAQLSDNFTNPAAPVPGHGMLTYLTMTGSHTGQFTGGVTQKGHEGTIAVLGLDTGVTVALGAGSGGAGSGRPVCDGVNFRKPTDRATPLIFAAAAVGETIIGATFNEYHTTPSGQDQLAFQIKLTNSHIASVHHVAATTTGAYDDIKLVPEAVKYTWKPTNTVTQWNCNAAAP
ncbi:MAG: type VI secretion system tube protein TssD [Solirubrobacteraceae bacterium]